MADAGTKGDGLLKAAFWVSLSVVIVNGVLSVAFLLGASDLPRPRWINLVVIVAAAVLIAVGVIPGWWERVRPPRR